MRGKNDSVSCGWCRVFFIFFEHTKHSESSHACHKLRVNWGRELLDNMVKGNALPGDMHTFNNILHFSTFPLSSYTSKNEFLKLHLTNADCDELRVPMHICRKTSFSEERPKGWWSDGLWDQRKSVGCRLPARLRFQRRAHFLLCYMISRAGSRLSHFRQAPAQVQSDGARKFFSSIMMGGGMVEKLDAMSAYRGFERRAWRHSVSSPRMAVNLKILLSGCPCRCLGGKREYLSQLSLLFIFDHQSQRIEQTDLDSLSSYPVDVHRYGPSRRLKCFLSHILLGFTWKVQCNGVNVSGNRGIMTMCGLLEITLWEKFAIHFKPIVAILEWLFWLSLFHASLGNRELCSNQLSFWAQRRKPIRGKSKKRLEPICDEVKGAALHRGCWRSKTLGLQPCGGPVISCASGWEQQKQATWCVVHVSGRHIKHVTHNVKATATCWARACTRVPHGASARGAGKASASFVDFHRSGPRWDHNQVCIPTPSLKMSRMQSKFPFFEFKERVLNVMFDLSWKDVVHGVLTGWAAHLSMSFSCRTNMPRIIGKNELFWTH